MSEERTINR